MDLLHEYNKMVREPTTKKDSITVTVGDKVVGTIISYEVNVAIEDTGVCMCPADPKAIADSGIIKLERGLEVKEHTLEPIIISPKAIAHFSINKEQ